MGFDTHMIAGGRACSTSIPPTHPTITSQTSPHFAEALGVASGKGFYHYPNPAFDRPGFV